MPPTRIPASKPPRCFRAPPQPNVRSSPTSRALPAAAKAPETAPIALAATGEPVFHDLFRTEGRGAVSQAVSELWGLRTASASSAGVAPGAPVSGSNGAEHGRGLDLFRSQRPPT